MSEHITPTGWHGTAFNKPKDWQAFERLMRDLVAAVFEDPNTDLHGRAGQKQLGVDILCTSKTGAQIGVQCKHQGPSAARPITGEMLCDEVEKAKGLRPSLNQLIVVSSGPNDVELQATARELSQAHAEAGLFAVHVHGWEWVESLLAQRPDIAARFQLIAAVEPPLRNAPTDRAIGIRFAQIIALMNAHRALDDQIGLTEIADDLKLPDWRALEALVVGEPSLGLEALKMVADGLGVSRHWLLHGKSLPFQIDQGSAEALDQLDELLALRPRQVVVARSDDPPFRVCLVAQVSEIRWKVFSPHPGGPDVGGTGRHQLFDLCCLLRRLSIVSFRENIHVRGARLAGPEFQALIDGELHASVLDRHRSNDPWWQDFAELDSDSVSGDAPDAVALRAAIHIARGVLVDYQSADRSGEWRRDRLRAANLPPTALGNSTRYDIDLREAASAAPVSARSWPKVTALSLERALFSFTAAHDKTLLDGVCHIDIASQAKVPLADCRIIVRSIEAGGSTQVLDLELKASHHEAAGPTGFPMTAGQIRRFYLCTRDLKDIINQPPWQLRLQDRNWPMEDGHRYVLTLELRSNYPAPTHARLELAIDYGSAVSATVLDQAV